MGVVDCEQLPDHLRLDAVGPGEPVDALFPVNQQILGPEPGAAQHRLARHLARHDFDQRALGPVDVLHGPCGARAQGIVPLLAPCLASNSRFQTPLARHYSNSRLISLNATISVIGSTGDGSKPRAM
jgi:hypothetical protein